MIICGLSLLLYSSFFFASPCVICNVVNLTYYTAASLHQAECTLYTAPLNGIRDLGNPIHFNN